MYRYIKTLLVCVFACFSFAMPVAAQINTDQVMIIGRNALYFEDYILSIQYFNQVIKAKPYLAEPYFFRAVAKFYLEDYRGAEKDCDLAIERNPFIVDAYQVRGISRQELGNDKGAIEDYNQGLKYLPESKFFLINKAVAQQKIEDYKGSAETYAVLTRLFPKFDNAYLGRAQLNLSVGDTIAALDDISKCIEVNENNADAFVMRADILIKKASDYEKALQDMNSAIKLEPKKADYFVNRAFLKYNLDDYFGAMADFDYAIELDPSNVPARFNRGLLRMEVQDDNKAIEDFSYVLEREPDNFMALYNRATLYQQTRQYKLAIADYDKVIERYPNLPMAYFARSESKRLSGDRKGGEQDYYKSRELHEKQAAREYAVNEEDKSEEKEETPEEVMKKFKTLMTVENDNEIKPEYDNKYRGKVQNYNAQIEMQDSYILSYFDKTTDLRSDAYYQKEVDQINSSHYLRDRLYITNVKPKLTEEQINVQFELIRHYSSLLMSSEPRAIDYFGRAMSSMMVKDYESAINDLTEAVRLSPQFVLGYFARSVARMCQMEVMREGNTDVELTSAYSARKAERETIGELKAANDRYMAESVLNDLDKVLEMSPNQIYAYFNKGNMYLSFNDYTAALACYTSAINIKADFGEAYFNRGMVYLQLGNIEKGVADLSKAGELGIMSSYNVLKRMRR